MASNVHEVAFKIAGKMSGSFSKAFSSANEAVTGFNKQLVTLNTKAAQMDKVVRLRKETGEAAREYIHAKQKVAELGRQMSATAEPTKELIAEFNKAKAAVGKAKTALDKKRTALREVEQAADTTGESLKSLIRRQEQLEKSAEKVAAAQEKMAKATELQGKLKGMASSSAMALGGIAAAAAPVGLAVKEAMNFEDMQAELGKYSDDSKAIFAGLTDLTKKYSKTAQDMTDMAANAMQAGVAKTKEDVLTLVESQTQAAVAFGMTGDAVGSAWADIQSKMQTSVGETKAVFDIVNKLGNETSASSEDILDVLQRQGGTVKSLTALNEKQVAAMAGAFRSASNSSEVAATSMGTFFSRLTVGSTATKAQQKAFEALGLDAEDMAKRMTSSSESAQSAVQDVFARINKLSPDKRGAIIGQLFGNEAGIKAAVATLSKNSNMLGNNLEVVGDKANYTGSMFKEYMARASTTSEAMGIARNQVTLIAARLGQTLLPTVKKVTQSFIQIAGKVATFVEKNQGLILSVLKVVGIIVGAIAAFHAVRIAIAFVISPILSLYKGFMMIKTVVTLASVAFGLATSTIWIIIGAVVAAIAIGVLLWKNWDKIKAKCTELWAAFQEKFPLMANIVKSVYETAIKPVVDGIKQVFGGLIDFVAGVFTGNWSRAWEGVKNIFGGAFKALSGLAKAPLNAVIRMINGVIGGLNGLNVKIPKWVPKWGGKSFALNIPKIPALAEGGIATAPTLAMIGEGKEREAVLPLSKLDAMLSGGTGGGGIIVDFHPVINISGGSSDVSADVQRGISAGIKDLKKELEKILRDQRRLSYS